MPTNPPQNILPRTDRKTSMPPRTQKPGYKGGRFRPELGRRLPYWYAKNVVRNPMGFPDPCIALSPEADETELARLCQEHTARLFAWIDERIKAEQRDGVEDLPRLPRYTGIIESACEWYERHPRSRFHQVKANTRESYVDSLKIIRATVGKRLIRNATVFDVQHWYEEWRKPAYEGGPERIKRAHDAVVMVKTVLRFNGALRPARLDCKQLIDDLEKAGSITRFERGGARE